MEKVLVVDDEKKIAQVVKAYLEKDGFEVALAYDGSEAMRLAREEKFALIMLDLMLPGIPGEDICRKLRQAGNSVPIIMLTAKGAEEERIQGLGLGADDYIVKPFSPGEMVARVHAVLRRTKAYANGILADVLEFNAGTLVIDTLRHQVTHRGKKLELTATEYKLLAVMARTPGRVFTRGELLEVAQGALPTGFDRTIDSHIKNLRQKIEDKPEQPSYVKTVYGVGYKFEGEAS